MTNIHEQHEELEAVTGNIPSVIAPEEPFNPDSDPEINPDTPQPEVPTPPPAHPNIPPLKDPPTINPVAPIEPPPHIDPVPPVEFAAGKQDSEQVSEYIPKFRLV